MNNNKKIHLMQGTLRAGVCIFMLSGACVLSAQTPDQQGKEAGHAKTAQVAQKKAPQYKMKEISGYVFDGATKKPLGGVKVQSLNNRYYTALTDDNGKYTIRVPEFVEALYINVQDYNPAQLAIKGEGDQNVYLTSGMNSDFYHDGTSMNNNQKMVIDAPNSLTIENEMEKGLAGSLRILNRGGMPAQGAAMFINGVNSLNTSAQPLVIIDGVMMDMQYDRTSLHQGFINNVFSIVDPDDIESVEVVKNGTSLYGAKGANGVLLITTRRGHSMETRINFRAYAGFETTPEQIKVMNAGQYRSYFSELIGTQPNQEYFGSNKTIPFLNEDKNYFFYNLYHNETDWQKDLYHSTFTQNYKISVDGGDDVAMYHLSLGYAKSDATAKENDFNRLNIRFNTDVNMFKNFVTGIDFAYARNAYNLRDNGWAESYANNNVSSPNVLGLVQTPFISPYAYFIHSDGNNLSLVHSNNVYTGKVYSDSNNPLRFANAYGYTGLANPYWILQNGEGDNKNYQEQTQFNINISPSYKINRYLTVKDRFSYILNRSNEKYYLPKYGTPSKNVEGLGSVTSVVSTQFAKETTVYNDFSVDWHRNYGAHDIQVLGGFRLNSYSYSASHISGYNNDQDKMPNMSYALQYKTYGGTNDKWNNMAYYVNVGYNFMNKYFLNGTMSMEASSRFGKKADSGIKLCGVTWGLFPSLQGAWLVSSEKWFNVKGIDYLKLTGGYEVSGNDNIDYYATRTYFTNTQFLDRATALVLENIQNPKLQWETTKRYNIGLQASALNNRLNFAIEYFHSKTDNLLTRKAVSDITGLASMWSNDGSLKNNGVDFNVNAMLVQHKDWRWQAGFSIGHYKNEITSLPSSSLNTIKTYALDENGVKIADSENRINGYTSSIYGSNNILTTVGQAAGVFYGYKTKGVFASDAEAQTAGKYGYLRYPTGIAEQPYRNFKAGDVHFVDQNGDGWINEADMVVIGDPNPDIYGNIYTSLSWKGLKLDVNFKYSLGNDVYNYQRSQLESLNTNWNQTTAAVNRWRYEGQVTDMPRVMSTSSEQWVNNERFSDRWIEDGSYLKLKNIRLTYKIPVNLSWLLGLSVWGECNNVFTVSKYTGVDPEFSAGNGVLYQGIDAGYLPQNRNFSLGVTINL